MGTYEDSDPLTADTLQRIEKNEAIENAGWQSDIRPYLAASDIFVFPSYREGFPNVVLQAGAMGLPAIVTDINGCNEIIKEGVNGTIIKPRDRQQLKSAMERVLVDKNLRESLAANARPLIASRYEQKSLWQALRRLYRSLIEE